VETIGQNIIITIAAECVQSAYKVLHRRVKRDALITMLQGITIVTCMQ